MAVEDASLSTEMLSMSDELISASDVTAFMTPSTMIRGSLDASIERDPRIRMDVPSVGSPDTLMMSAPAIRPWRAWSADSVGDWRTLLMWTLETEPVRSDFFVSPNPITTTSSRKLVSGLRFTLRVVFFPTIIFTGE